VAGSEGGSEKVKGDAGSGAAGGGESGSDGEQIPKGGAEETPALGPEIDQTPGIDPAAALLKSGDAGLVRRGEANALL